MSERCPLCGGDQLVDYHRDKRRQYLQCQRCQLVFVPLRYHLDAVAEKAEYDLHQNSVHDTGYRGFLARLAEPLIGQLPAGAAGLDFGCGPAPALAAMLREAGHSVALYDYYYHPDPAPLGCCYDFVCATEVVEHLAAPGDELARLWACLRPGGILAIMTKLVRDAQAFASWHYKNDPTHISFFSCATWSWWGLQHGVQPVFVGADVILFKRAAR